MTEDPPNDEPTDAERAEIARLCGGELNGDGHWEFRATPGKYSPGIILVPHDEDCGEDWLRLPDGIGAAELVQESILLRGLARAGVLRGVMRVDDDFAACPFDPCEINTLNRAFYDATIIAACKALALAHVRAAAKEGGK